MALNEDYADWTELVTGFAYRVNVHINEDENTLQESAFSDSFDINKMERHSMYIPPNTSVDIVDISSGNLFTHLLLFTEVPVEVEGSTPLMKITVQKMLCLDFEIGTQSLTISTSAFTVENTLPNVEIVLVGEVE